MSRTQVFRHNDFNEIPNNHSGPNSMPNYQDIDHYNQPQSQSQSSFIARLLKCEKGSCFCFLTILIFFACFLGCVFGLIFIPTAPDYSLCNENIQWGSIFYSLLEKGYVSSNVTVQMSLYNPNRFNIELHRLILTLYDANHVYFGNARVAYNQSQWDSYYSNGNNYFDNQQHNEILTLKYNNDDNSLHVDQYHSNDLDFIESELIPTQKQDKSIIETQLERNFDTIEQSTPSLTTSILSPQSTINNNQYNINSIPIQSQPITLSTSFPTTTFLSLFTTTTLSLLSSTSSFLTSSLSVPSQHQPSQQHQQLPQSQHQSQRLQYQSHQPQQQHLRSTPSRPVILLKPGTITDVFMDAIIEPTVNQAIKMFNDYGQKNLTVAVDVQYDTTVFAWFTPKISYNATNHFQKINVNGETDTQGSGVVNYCKCNATGWL